MVVHSPLVLVLPRAAWDRCSPMVCILFFNLENSIGQEEEVWDLGVGVLALPMAFICLLCRSAVCVGVMGTHALLGQQRGLLPGPHRTCVLVWMLPAGRAQRAGE